MVIFKVILVVGLVCLYVPRLRPTVIRRVKEDSHKNARLLLLELLAIMTVGIQLYFVEISIINTTFVGLFIFVVGALLSTIARFQLRSNYRPAFSAKIPEKIVTDGAYCFVRHPVYLGTLLVIIGLELSLQPILAIVALAIIPVFMSQANKEEKLMNAFNEEYLRFTRSTRYKLIPLVW